MDKGYWRTSKLTIIHLSICAVWTYDAGICMLSKHLLCSSVYLFALQYKSTAAKIITLKTSCFTLWNFSPPPTPNFHHTKNVDTESVELTFCSWCGVQTHTERLNRRCKRDRRSASLSPSSSSNPMSSSWSGPTSKSSGYPHSQQFKK